MSTNAGAEPLAFQTWRNFKEAFAPELIGQAFEETSKSLGRSVRSAIDPFGGSGTTALACQFLGVKPLTIEVNPYLADLIRAKIATYDTDQLIADYSIFTSKVGRPSLGDPFTNSPPTFVEPGVKGKYLFNKAVAGRLSQLYRKLCKVECPKNRRLFRVLLCSIAVDCSNAVVSGKGRRYRKGWEDREISPTYVDDLLFDAFERVLFEVQRYRNRLVLDGSVLQGDCRDLIPVRRKFDMAVFSPPYPNSFDYTDVYNIELWVGGYLANSSDNRSLRMQTLRSHVQIARNYSVGKVPPSEKLSEVLANLTAVRSELWSRHIPDMIGAYFADMAVILRRLRSCIAVGGNVYLVVGDSQYRDISIPVADVLVDFSSSLGFQVIAKEPFRSMRSSPQQGGRKELQEVLITLQRSALQP